MNNCIKIEKIEKTFTKQGGLYKKTKGLYT